MNKLNSNKMKVIICILGLYVIGCLYITGCGNKKIVNNNKNIKAFSIDDSTKEKSEWSIADNTIQNTDNTNNEYSEPVGELILNNEDKSVSYEIINDTDIKYRSTTFTQLNTIINNLNTKYDKNTLINFIIKKYVAHSDLIYVNYITDTDTTGQEESADMEVDELELDNELQGNYKYEELKEKYNERVNWRISLTDSKTRDTVYLYGCYSYILIDTDGDVIIDMSEFDSTLE